MKPSDAANPTAEPAPMTPPRTALPGPSAIAGRSVTPATLADLWADLVWPKLLESVRLALRPSRIGLGIAFVLGVAAIVQLAGAVDGLPNANRLADYFDRTLPRQLDGVVGQAIDRNANLGAQSVYAVFVGLPSTLLRQHPWSMILAMPLLTLWTGLFGTAICRMAACDHAMGLRITWPQGLGFALGRWSSSWLALLIPLLLLWVVCLIMAGVGWAAFNIPVLNAVAGALYVLFLIGGLVAAVVMVAYFVGHPMLLPAVAVESADAVDAVQHTYAFVFCKPLRLLVYALILIVQGAIALFVVGLVLELSAVVAQRSASAFLSEDLVNKVLQPNLYAGSGNKATGTDAAARWGVKFWMAVPGIVLAGFSVSLYFCSSTMLYLAMRRVCDGQDTAEVWQPGMVPGTTAPARRPA